MTPATRFVVEQFQLQTLAGDLGQGMDGQIEPLGVLAAPDCDLFSAGPQAYPDPLASTPSNQEGEVEVLVGLRSDSGESARPVALSPLLGW